jgi:MFS family permease
VRQGRAYCKVLAQHNIELLRFLVFLKVFANGLSIVFMAKYMLSATLNSGLSAFWASVLYSCYQIFFVLTVIPSGYFVEHRDLKKVLVMVIFLEALAFLGLGMVGNFWWMLLFQAAFGLLVPISSSIEYAYIFRFSSHTNRGQMLAAYNNTLKGAMIAGTACGGILSSWFDVAALLKLAAVLNVGAALYCLAALPRVRCRCTAAIQRLSFCALSIRGILKNLPKILSNLRLAKLFFLIAVPLGLLEDGIILFGMPLFLANNGATNFNISYFLVLFAVGFFCSSRYIARKTDILRREGLFMFFGLLGLAIGLVMIFVIRESGFPVYWCGFGLFLVGFSRGVLIAPVISHLTKNGLTGVLGKNVVMAHYRLFENMGRILGPMLVMQIFTFTGYVHWIFLFSGLTFLVICLTMRSSSTW